MAFTTAKPRRPDPTQLDMDLAEFGQHIDTELGKVTGFAEAVAQWRRASTLATRIGKDGAARAVLHREIDRAIGTRSVLRHSARTITKLWKEEQTSPYFKSALVQAAAPELWAASRVSGLRLAHFKSAAERQPWEPLPLTVAQRHDLPGTLEIMENRAKHARAAVETNGQIVKDVVAELHAGALWAPGARYVLTDGWELEYGEQTAYREWRVKELLDAGEFDVDPAEITALKITRRAGFVYDVSITDTVRDQFGEGDIDSDHWAQ